MQQYQIKIKEAIKSLINIGNVNEANELIVEYEKLVLHDFDMFSMKAVIAIMQGELLVAEKILLQGLEIDKYCFDLLYNLAYVYKEQGQYCQAILYCNNAKKIVLYDTDSKNQVDDLLNDICQQNTERIEEERNNNIVYKNLALIKKVLFIDFELSMQTNQLAKILDQYGISIDLAYSGKNPVSIFKEDDLPYGKIIGFSDIVSLVEYANCYDYDIIHSFPNTNFFKDHIKKINTSVVNYSFNSDELNIQKIIGVYSKAQQKGARILKSKVVANSENEKKLTIVIPTYNRAKYLNRILSFFNNFNEKNMNIIILDSSYDNIKQDNKKVYEKFNDLAISYFEFEDSINAWVKINYGLEQVKTPFVCLCADDDFVTEEGLAESVRVLTKEEDLFSVKGKNLYYIKTMSKVQEYDFFAGSTDNDSIIRMQKLVEGFVPSLIYQVFRIDDFKKLYCFWVENKDFLPTNPAFQEYLVYFMVILTGKVGKVNVDFNVRDKGVPRETVMKNFPHALLDGTFNQNYHDFKAFILKYIKTLNISPEIFLEKSDEMFAAFLINFLQVPKQNVRHINGEFDLENLQTGMLKSWVWPR